MGSGGGWVGGGGGGGGVGGEGGCSFTLQQMILSLFYSAAQALCQVAGC